MVELQVTTGQGTVALIGVAVAEGGLVATTADLLGGVRRLVMVGPGGRLEPATVVATDTASDVALVTVPVDLPVAPFADDTTVSGGSPDLTLSFVPAAGSSIALHCTPGAVSGAGAPIANGPAGGMPSISSTPTAPELAAGDPLLNADGAVVGLLYEADRWYTCHLPPQPARRRGGQRPALQGPRGAGMARGLGLRRPGRCGGHGGAGGPQRAGRRPAPAGPGDRGRRTRSRCARWPNCGPGSTSCPPAPPWPSRSSRPRAARSWASGSAPPPSMRG